MVLPHINTDKVQPLEAWAGLSPHEGVRTRRRDAKLESTSNQNRSQSSEAVEASSTTENEQNSAQQDQSQDEQQSGVGISNSAKGKKPAATLRIGKPRQRSHVTPKRQVRSIERVVTTRELNVSSAPNSATSHQADSKPGAENEPQIFEDEEGYVASFASPEQDPLNSGSPKHTMNRLEPELSDQPAVLEHGLPDKIQISPTEPSSSASNNILHLDHQSFDNNHNNYTDTNSDSDSNNDNNSESEMDRDSCSDVTATHGEEAINQLRAVNEDLRSEGKYYRLMAEITMKTTAVRRGYMRSPIVPANLSLRLRELYNRLMSEGLLVPNSASDRARVVADVIQLHLTWEADNLQHNINPSFAINSFVEFAALLIPQIQGLAIGEFVGGEETNEVRAQISAAVIRLMGWIVEKIVLLADKVRPQYISYRAMGWDDMGLRALWEIDTCLEAACRQRMLASGEAGLYSAPIMHWAARQLTWLNNMAGRLHQMVDMVPNHCGVTVPLFGLTTQGLENHIHQGQNMV